MNHKAFLNVLLSTALTLLLVSALFFYLFSHPKESAASAYAIGEQTAKAIAETSKDSLKHFSNETNTTLSDDQEPSPKKELKESFSIVGRTIQEG